MTQTVSFELRVHEAASPSRRPSNLAIDLRHLLGITRRFGQTGAYPGEDLPDALYLTVPTPNITGLAGLLSAWVMRDRHLTIKNVRSREIADISGMTADEIARVLRTWSTKP